MFGSLLKYLFYLFTFDKANFGIYKIRRDGISVTLELESSMYRKGISKISREICTSLANPIYSFVFYLEEIL